MDYAFPRATKIGAVLGSGVRSPSRVMFAWNAESEAQNEKKRTRGALPSRAAQVSRQAELEQTTSTASSSGSSSSTTQSASGGTEGFLQSLGQMFSRFTSSAFADGGKGGNGGLAALFKWDSSQQQQQQPQQQRVWGFQTGDDANDQDDDDEDDDDSSGSGTFLYGAVVLVLHGDVVMDTLLAQGYRAPSSKIWRIATCDDFDVMTLVEEKGGRSSAGEEDEVAAYEALLDLFTCMAEEVRSQSAGEPSMLNQALTPDALGTLNRDLGSLAISDLVIAIAPDHDPEAWETCRLGQVIDRFGLSVPEAELKPGYRLKMLVRDKQGIQEDLREVLLRYKRQDLGLILKGEPLAPTFGTLLFSDYVRGAEFYNEENYESRVVAQYLPVPLSGVHGSGQVVSLNGDSNCYEHALVVGVLRASGGAPGSALPEPQDKV